MFCGFPVNVEPKSLPVQHKWLNALRKLRSGRNSDRFLAPFLNVKIHFR